MIIHSWELLGIHAAFQAAGLSPEWNYFSLQPWVGRKRTRRCHVPEFLPQDECKPGCALRYPRTCKNCHQQCRPPVVEDGPDHRYIQSEPLFHLQEQSEPEVKGGDDTHITNVNRNSPKTQKDPIKNVLNIYCRQIHNCQSKTVITK